jgi:hypothetical protein
MGDGWGAEAGEEGRKGKMGVMKTNFVFPHHIDLIGLHLCAVN